MPWLATAHTDVHSHWRKKCTARPRPELRAALLLGAFAFCVPGMPSNQKHFLFRLALEVDVSVHWRAASLRRQHHYSTFSREQIRCLIA